MNSSPVSRRHLLRSGGLVTAAGVALAACGEPQNKSATRLGDAPEVSALAEEKVDDVVILRTAMSMEALVHSMLTDSIMSSLSPLTGPVVEAFADDHESNLATLTTLVSAKGGEPVTEPNAKLKSVFGDPALELVKESDQKGADALALAHALESLLAATYQNFVASIVDAPLRADLMRLGVSASRKSAVLAQSIRGGAAAFAPAVDENGAALVSTLPSAFGSLSSVQVTIGAPNEAGSRTLVTMDTPSLNSYVY